MSLLGRIPNFRSRDAHRRFSFGLGEWTDSSSDEEVMELERPTKKLKLSVLRAHAQDRWHFISEAQEQELSKKFVPKNTASTKWAISIFTLWKKGRKERSMQIPDDLLLSDDAIAF